MEALIQGQNLWVPRIFPQNWGVWTSEMAVKWWWNGNEMVVVEMCTPHFFRMWKKYQELWRVCCWVVSSNTWCHSWLSWQVNFFSAALRQHNKSCSWSLRFAVELWDGLFWLNAFQWLVSTSKANSGQGQPQNWVPSLQWCCPLFFSFGEFTNLTFAFSLPFHHHFISISSPFHQLVVKINAFSHGIPRFCHGPEGNTDVGEIRLSGSESGRPSSDGDASGMGWWDGNFWWKWMGISVAYPLVNIEKTMENHHVSWDW